MSPFQELKSVKGIPIISINLFSPILLVFFSQNSNLVFLSIPIFYNTLLGLGTWKINIQLVNVYSNPLFNLASQASKL